MARGPDRWRLSCGLMLWMALSTLPAGAQNRFEACEPFDFDENRRIDTLDIGPLLEEYETLTDCLPADLRPALDCASFDANGDGAVGMMDYVALQSTHDIFSECMGADIADRPGCAEADTDLDGEVSTLDYGQLGFMMDQFRVCLAVDHSALECREVDYDDDLQVTTVDENLFYERVAGLTGCLGLNLGASRDFWISRSDLMELPTQGPAWNRLYAEANSRYLTPFIENNLDAADTRTLAKALVGIRLSRDDLVNQVTWALRSLVDRPPPSWARTLAIGRNGVAYVLAADIIDLPTLDPNLDARFRSMLSALRYRYFQNRTLVSTHEDRPNNWGTHAGATRIAIALYLEDERDLAEAAAVHRGFLGDGPYYSGFRFGSLTWQANASRPLGINPIGSSKDGIDIDGAIPDDMRRGGSFTDPPNRTGYPWEALQGATVATELLARNGYPAAWSWGDWAILRAVEYLERLDDAYGGWWATGDDLWNIWLINHGTGSAYPTESGVRAGKNIGFTDWTHAR